MVRKRTLISGMIAIAVLTTLVVSSGCNTTTPRQSFAAANDTFIAALSALTTARNTGVISEEEWKSDIVPIIRDINATLDALDVATKAGLGTGTLMETLRELLTQLRPFLIKAGGAS